VLFRSGIGQRLPTDLLRHWRRSRPTAWLERNPLLVVKTIHVPGSYYGSEWLLVSRVRATTVGAMLAALQPERQERTPGLFSSRVMNNWQTLDIHHYLTLRRHQTESRTQRPLHPDPCRPHLRVRAQ
jgi:hypothetical protein